MKTHAFALAMSLALGTSALAGDAIIGFSHDNRIELFGYFLPPDGTKTGHFVLHDFAIGQLDDMKKWESGKERSDAYAPVMFQFTDLTSKMIKNEESGEMEHQDVRVLPSAYRIKGNTIAFIGASKEIGTVVFTGTLDTKRVIALNANVASADPKQLPEDGVMKGDLTIAGKTFKNMSFSWFGGD
jgi:hypothetical protein